MKMSKRFSLTGIFFLMCFGVSHSLQAASFVQCPGDNDGDAIVDRGGQQYDNVKCMHLGAGDGFVTMADGYLQYIFSFVDLTGVTEKQALSAGLLAANFPAPTIVLNEGEEFYLTLSNYGMSIRPDLADPHTVHFHGFPNASDIFDGLPDATVSINMGASLTYYYNIAEPGTYMYHCHVEATEHMQMGMLGNLYVKPAQNQLAQNTDLNGFTHKNGFQYVYNDADGATYYDVEFPIQLGSFDPDFHDASMNVQPLPFAEMVDRYPMINGRGYPDTADARTADYPSTAESGANPDKDDIYGTGKLSTSQPVSSLVTASSGEKILLRFSNLNITRYYTVTALGLPMKVVGTGARILRGKGQAAGKDLSYNTSSVTLGGGESVDVIIDTAGIPAGKYFLYTTNLNYLSNRSEDFGGMMTEININ